MIQFQLRVWGEGEEEEEDTVFLGRCVDHV